MTGAASLRGYNPLFSAKNDATSNLADAHEGFEFGFEPFSNAKDNSKNTHPGEIQGKANLWPSEQLVPGFREAMLRY
jgi:phage terminase small subunit